MAAATRRWRYGCRVCGVRFVAVIVLTALITPRGEEEESDYLPDVWHNGDEIATKLLSLIPLHARTTGRGRQLSNGPSPPLPPVPLPPCLSYRRNKSYKALRKVKERVGLYVFLSVAAVCLSGGVR